MLTGQSDLATTSSDRADTARQRAALVRLLLEVVELPKTDVSRLLIREIEVANELLESGDGRYAEQLIASSATAVRRLRRRRTFGLRPPGQTITPVLAGLVLYSTFVIGVLGPCVVIVWSLNAGTVNGFTALADNLGARSIFETVRGLGVKPEAYLWGLFGGAGAVASIVKRFDQIASKRASFWLLFSQGVFNPIVGSLAAVVVCSFVYGTDQLNLLKIVPPVVSAFFAGFSERLLARLESTIAQNATATTENSTEDGKPNVASDRERLPS